MFAGTICGAPHCATCSFPCHATMKQSLRIRVLKNYDPGCLHSMVHSRSYHSSNGSWSTFSADANIPTKNSHALRRVVYGRLPVVFSERAPACANYCATMKQA